MPYKILCIAGPTASGKSSRAVLEAQKSDGEIISVDSRQVYTGLDIGTEKIAEADKHGIPHHLIDIRSLTEVYSAGDFVHDGTHLIKDISARGKLPILVGGTHFYFNALLNGLPMGVNTNVALRAQLEQFSTDELFKLVAQKDRRRARELDQKNKRRLIRALEIIDQRGIVAPVDAPTLKILPEWIILNPTKEVLVPRIEARLSSAFASGLINEVQNIRDQVGDIRLGEFGLEYRIIGEYLRGERRENALMQALTAKLWQYAKRQKAWLRKLAAGNTVDHLHEHAFPTLT